MTDHASYFLLPSNTITCIPVLIMLLNKPHPSSRDMKPDKHSNTNVSIEFCGIPILEENRLTGKPMYIQR